MKASIRYIQKRLTPSGEKRIYWKHAEVVRHAARWCVKHGMRYMGFTLAPLVEAYLRVYPKARSRAGARASMSRLMRRRDVRAAAEWFLAIEEGAIPRGTTMPETPSGIRAELEKAGCWRAKYVSVPPRIIVEIGNVSG